MAIIIGGQKQVASVSIGNRVISAIYVGARSVWLAVRSCFGAGAWTRTKAWSNTEVWRSRPR